MTRQGGSAESTALKGGCEPAGTEPRVVGSEILPEKRDPNPSVAVKAP